MQQPQQAAPNGPAPSGAAACASPVASSWDESLHLTPGYTSVRLEQQVRDEPCLCERDEEEEPRGGEGEGPSVQISSQQLGPTALGQRRRAVAALQGANEHSEPPPPPGGLLALDADQPSRGPNGRDNNEAERDEDNNGQQQQQRTGGRSGEQLDKLIRPKSALSVASAELIKAQRSLAAAAAAKVQRDRMSRMLKFQADAYAAAAQLRGAASLLTVQTDVAHSPADSSSSAAFWFTGAPGQVGADQFASGESKTSAAAAAAAAVPSQLRSGNNSAGMSDSSPSNNGAESDNSIQTSNTTTTDGSASSSAAAKEPNGLAASSSKPTSGSLGGILSRILLQNGAQKRPAPAAKQAELEGRQSAATAPCQSNGHGSGSSRDSPAPSLSPGEARPNGPALVEATAKLDQLTSRSRRPIVLSRSSELRAQVAGGEPAGGQLDGHSNGLPPSAAELNVALRLGGHRAHSPLGAAKADSLRNGTGGQQQANGAPDLASQIQVQAQLCNYHALGRSQLVGPKYSAYLPYQLGRYSIHEQCDPQAHAAYGAACAQQQPVAQQAYGSGGGGGASIYALSGYHAHPHHQSNPTVAYGRAAHLYAPDESIYISPASAAAAASSASSSSFGATAAGLPPTLSLLPDSPLADQQRKENGYHHPAGDSNRFARSLKQQVLAGAPDHAHYNHAGLAANEHPLARSGARPKSSLDSILLSASARLQAQARDNGQRLASVDYDDQPSANHYHHQQQQLQLQLQHRHAIGTRVNTGRASQETGASTCAGRLLGSPSMASLDGFHQQRRQYSELAIEQNSIYAPGCNSSMETHNASGARLMLEHAMSDGGGGDDANNKPTAVLSSASANMTATSVVTTTSAATNSSGSSLSSNLSGASQLTVLPAAGDWAPAHSKLTSDARDQQRRQPSCDINVGKLTRVSIGINGNCNYGKFSMNTSQENGSTRAAIHLNGHAGRFNRANGDHENGVGLSQQHRHDHHLRNGHHDEEDEESRATVL